MSTVHDAPTYEQQMRLRQLADEKGIAPVTPRTAEEAERQIAFMEARESQDSLTRFVQARQVSRDFARDFGGATQVRDDEIDGFGGDATWA